MNSRLIGAQVEARLYLDRVEVWYGQTKVEDLPRLRGRGKHRIDYRHIIEWLVRKAALAGTETPANRLTYLNISSLPTVAMRRGSGKAIKRCPKQLSRS